MGCSRSRCGWASGGNGLQQAFDVSAADYGEFIIIIPNLVEGDFFDLQRDDLITVTADKALRPKMRDRYRCDDSCCSEVPDGLDCAEHRPTRMHSIVNQQSGFPLETTGNNNSLTLKVQLQCQLFLSGDASNLG